MMRQTSLLSYDALVLDGTLGKQAMQIVKFMRSNYPLVFTRNQISMMTGIRINAVCGRVNQLVKDKYLEEVGKVEDNFTRKQSMGLRAGRGF